MNLQKALRRALSVISFVLLCATLSAQSVHPVTGRRIAPVMGFRGAEWLERPGRQSEEDVLQAIADLQLRPGMSVADIGAGTGYYSIRMAKKVLPAGKVFAVDIQPQMLDVLQQRAGAAGVSNIVPLLGTESDPRLGSESVDIVLLVDVYHELSRPQRMLQCIREGLRPGGKLVLLEYRKEDLSVPIRPEHKMSLEEVKAEVVPEGFTFVNNMENLPWQHMIFFEKTAGR